MAVRSQRCAACLHSREAHEHYTRPSDLRCSECGPTVCPSWVDPHSLFPLARMTAGQREVRRLADERHAFNVACLIRFAQSSKPPPPVPIPEQRTSARKKRQQLPISEAYRQALLKPTKPRRKQ